ncbi:hypothetical protein HK104_004592, partial [Borealophlyctis nickersoniae]
MRTLALALSAAPVVVLAQNRPTLPDNVHYDVEWIDGKCSRGADMALCGYTTAEKTCDFMYKFDKVPNWVAALDPAYTGDPTQFDLTVEAGSPSIVNGMLRTPLLPPRTPGSVIGQATILATTRFLQYGSVEVRMTKAPGSTVITSVNPISNTLDEIDIEFTGTNPTEVQTNWYYRGNMSSRGQHFAQANAGTSLIDNFHTYRIDWFPDMLAFYMDGVQINNLTRESTCEGTPPVCGYPSDPSRIKLGVWNAQVDPAWAGPTPVNWASPPANLYAQFDYIHVKCMDAVRGGSTATTRAGGSTPTNSAGGGGSSGSNSGNGSAGGSNNSAGR